MSDLSHQRIGDYALHEEIGRGGMAVVYRATHPNFGLVAFKVLPPYFTHNTDILRRFMNEARAVEALRHPHVVQLHEAGELPDPYSPANPVHFIAMEYVGGGSLQDRLGNGTRLPLETVLQLGYEIGYALEYAHLKGFIHRDIKPSNILFRDDGRAVLADFGIARAADQSRITRTGGITGTIAYLAPEIVRGQRADQRSDIYALSLVLYEALSGINPFADDTSLPLLTLQKIVTTELPSLHQQLPHLSPLIADVVTHGVAKDPNQRLGSAAEFITALRQAQAGRSIPAVVPRPVTTPTIDPVALASVAPPVEATTRFGSTTRPPTDPAAAVFVRPAAAPAQVDAVQQAAPQWTAIQTASAPQIKRRRVSPAVLATIIGSVVVGLGLILGLVLMGGATTPTSNVPDNGQGAFQSDPTNTNTAATSTLAVAQVTPTRTLEPSSEPTLERPSATTEPPTDRPAPVQAQPQPAAPPQPTPRPAVVPPTAIPAAPPPAPPPPTAAPPTAVPDRDGDGVPDNADACPDVAGPNNGCPAPTAPPPTAVPDRDGDGVPDNADACPDVAGPNNGCPAPTAPPPTAVPDRDGDNIPDDRDACPDEAGTGSDGCPPPPPRPTNPPPAPEPPTAVPPYPRP